MDFDEYQARAAKSDQHPRIGPLEESFELAAMTIPLFGLAGEAGELLGEYKKRLRRGKGYKQFADRVREELGDLLWYLSNVATKFDLALSEVASGNIAKIEQRWLGATTDAADYSLFDNEVPPDERLPRQGEITLALDGGGRAQMWFEGKTLGDPLTDNRHHSDEYRFHDVFHLAYMATLGWSPVIRKLLGRKSKSHPKVDEVEDGARAIIVEETISNLIFLYAEDHGFAVEGGIGWEALRAVKNLTNHLEVNVRTEGDWERAVICGFDVWNAVRDSGGGVLHFDLAGRTLHFVGPCN